MSKQPEALRLADAIDPLKLLAALLIPSVLVWLSVGFVLWNWNPETWAEGARFIFVGFSFVLTIPAVVIFGDIA